MGICEERVAALWAKESLSGQERLTRMRDLAAEAPHPALSAFELGGALDSSGHEAEAEERSAAARALGLRNSVPQRPLTELRVEVLT